MADEEAAKKRAWDGVKAIFERYFILAREKEGNLFDYDCMTNVELIDVDPVTKTIVYAFTPSQKYANINNIVHGGALGILFDMFTMSALGTVSKKDYWEFMAGVSRSINMSFIKSIPIGCTVYFRCRVVQHGKTMALIRGEVTNKDGSVVYATAEHHKVNVPMLPEHRAARIPFDDVLDREAEEEKKQKQKQKETSKL